MYIPILFVCARVHIYTIPTCVQTTISGAFDKRRRLTTFSYVLI